MLNLREVLRASVGRAVRKAQKAKKLPAGEIPPVPVAYPPAVEGETFGDYSSPIALLLGRQWKRNPQEVLEVIATHFQPPEFVGKVEGVSPGFLNFTLAPAWLSAKVDDILEEGASLGRSDAGQGRSVNLEFVSANPTGPLHVGNGRTLFVADVLGNVLQHAGYAVTKEYYVNDVGTQVERYGESVLRRILEAEGHTVDYPKDLYQGEDVRSVAEKVREEMREDSGHRFSVEDLADSAVRHAVTESAVEAALAGIRQVVGEVCRVRYDVWFRESTLHARGEIGDVLARLRKGGHAIEKDGAVLLRSTAFGDDADRVLIRASGEPTYLASDLAYHRDKYRRGFQVIADFWGADHHGHVAPLRAGLAALGLDPDRLRILLAQMVRVVQGGEAREISKRHGTAVPLADVVGLVGLDAARFFLTLKTLPRAFDFDLDLARAEREENPVYYAQYAHVRLASIIRKAKEQNIVDGSLLPPAGAHVPLTENVERALLARLFRFPEVLEDIVASWEVHRLPQYVLDLARAVHRFYDTVPVLTAGGSELLRARLSLVAAARAVLGAAFDLLGVDRREVM